MGADPINGALANVVDDLPVAGRHVVDAEWLLGKVPVGIADVHVVLRLRRARVKAWFHGLYNLGANPQVEGRGERNEFAFESGISWGMERLFQRWDFRLSLRYIHIEADALMPEFNSEILNTNIKAWHMELQVRIFPTVTAFGTATLSEREDFELNGFGLPNKNNPGRASGQSFRAKIGLFLEF
jgi:hypothetical protein